MSRIDNKYALVREVLRRIAHGHEDIDDLVSNMNDFSVFFVPLDIWAPPGTKVRVIYDENGEPKNGYTGDKELVKSHLKNDELYTIDSIDVGSSHSSVKLKEIPSIPFNSVCFEQERIITQEFLDAADHLAFIAARYATEGNDAHLAVMRYQDAKRNSDGK